MIGIKVEDFHGNIPAKAGFSFLNVHNIKIKKRHLDFCEFDLRNKNVFIFNLFEFDIFKKYNQKLNSPPFQGGVASASE